MVNRETFGSNKIAILAMAGSAIGLGNIWRFPYMVGQNGGAAFIIIYILSCFLLAVPILMSETIIGHRTHQNTFGAMKTLAPGTKWSLLGLLTVISPFIILSYYSVVGGWSIDFLYKSVFEGFKITDGQLQGTSFGSFISSTWGPIICHTIFSLLCVVIVSAGVKSGIEKFNKICMPMLFILIIFILIFSISLPGASAGIDYMLKPDFSKITGPIVASAVGQSFFSLSLGVGTILIYSSYIKSKENILNSGIGTTAFDLIFALLAGFAVMPAVFAAGIEPGAGPGLIFETLPFIFAKMGFGIPWISSVVAIFFFLAVVFAALTSAISMYEAIVAYFVEEKNMSRRKATILVFFGTWFLGLFCSLSFGPLSHLKIMNLSLFDFCDKFTSNFLMTIGGLLFVIFAGWKMKKQEVWEEFTGNGKYKLNCKIFGVFYFILKFIAPIGVGVVFISNFI